MIYSSENLFDSKAGGPPLPTIVNSAARKGHTVAPIAKRSTSFAESV